MVYLGCYNKMPQIVEHVNSRNLFLIALKAGKCEIKVPIESESKVSLLSGL
jgi:hypothetical protein